jgi:hypothetical protein
MRIYGKLGEYEVTTVKVGYSYAEAFVRVRVVHRIFFGLIKVSTFKKVWKSSGKFGSIKMNEVEKAHPEQLRDWYKDVVDEYERYKVAWERDQACEASIRKTAKGDT